MTENEIDVVGVKRLADLGFKEENGNGILKVKKLTWVNLYHSR